MRYVSECGVDRSVGGGAGNGTVRGTDPGVRKDSGKTLGGEHVRLLFDILLFAINIIGIVGAFLEAFLADWRSELDQPLFWGGLIVLSAVSVLWWRRPGKPERSLDGYHGPEYGGYGHNVKTGYNKAPEKQPDNKLQNKKLQSKKLQNRRTQNKEP